MALRTRFFAAFAAGVAVEMGVSTSASAPSSFPVVLSGSESMLSALDAMRSADLILALRGVARGFSIPDTAALGAAPVLGSAAFLPLGVARLTAGRVAPSLSFLMALRYPLPADFELLPPVSSASFSRLSYIVCKL